MRKRNRAALLKEGEVDINGAAAATEFTASTLRTYFNKLEGAARPPFRKRGGILVANEAELKEWEARWDAGEFEGAFAGR